MEHILSYFELESLLGRANCEQSAGENHGIICGLLVVNAAIDAELWLQYVFPQRDEQDAMQNQLVSRLKTVMDALRLQMQDSNLEFNLLLLDDAEALIDRVEVLQEWLQGFLMGVSLAGIRDFQKLPDDSKELMKDFLQISSAGTMDLDDLEESEQAYTEIIEYIRMGVLLIAEELQPSLSSATLH
ncbi:MAG TPA: YecA family protein [Thiothrix sp.]|nr:YecA family protein [Thiothrix sp.]